MVHESESHHGRRPTSDAPAPPRSALEGVRILELCSFVAGPYCTKLMADMGADVVKAEPTNVGDESRRRGPFYRGQPDRDSSLIFINLNANKRGITLNVDTSTGRDLLRELLIQVDVLVEDLPWGEVERLGLDYPSLRQVNSRVVVTSITPFGRWGPYRDYKAYYLNTYHSGGDGYLTPGGRLPDKLYPDREPLKAGGYLGEYQTGISAAIATVGALIGRMMDGRGQHIDVSKQEVMVNLNSADYCLYPNQGFMLTRKGRYYPFYIGGLYPCKDGFWETLLQSQRQWEAMVEVMGHPAWAEDEEYATHESRLAIREEIDEKIDEWAMGHTREEICTALQQRGCAAGPVYSVEELSKEEQLQHRGFFAEVEHPRIGRYRSPTAAYKLSRTPWTFRRPAPLLGQHNLDIYGGWLGYGGQELAELRRKEVI